MIWAELPLVHRIATLISLITLLFIWIYRLKFKLKVKQIMRHYVVIGEKDLVGRPKVFVPFGDEVVAALADAETHCIRD